MKNIICPRCCGHGKIEKYNHVESGICFKCSGSGYIEVNDNVRDIVQEIRDNRKQEKAIEKEFNNLYEPLKQEIKSNIELYNYILCNGNGENTQLEERLLRLKQYIEFKTNWKNYIKNHFELMDDIEKYYDVKLEFQSEYMNRE